MRRSPSSSSSASGTKIGSPEIATLNQPSTYIVFSIPSSVLLEADGCCIDLNECASSSKQRERATINILQLAMVTANHEDETRSLFDRFLEGSAQKYRICGSHRSLLAEGSRRTSPLSCTGQPHYSILFSDDPL